MLRAVTSFLAAALILRVSCAGAEEPVDALRYARGAANWILSISKERNGGLTWPVNDSTRNSAAFDLYSGMPAGILLLAELDKEDPAGIFRKSVSSSIIGFESLKIGDAWGEMKGGKLEIIPGLYTGQSGIGWLYLELHRITGEPSCLSKAGAIARQISTIEGTRTDGVVWDGSTDIISGAAGIGLFMLRAASDCREPRFREAADRAGRYLISQAIETPTGLKWRASKSAPQLYPNFSHGSSGIAYFLLRLYEETKDTRFWRVALAAAQELESIADLNTNKDRCVWYHHEGDGESLSYAGWCHGPAGTARLFYLLARTSSLPRWQKWVACSANWLTASGIPDPPKPVSGFWNEGICCGTAGIGEFFVDLYLATKKKEYLRSAETMARHLAGAAEAVGPGYRWLQAEHRISPAQKDAQTGYAQGAAGIGLFFLKLSRAQRGVPVGWRLPDSPY